MSRPLWQVSLIKKAFPTPLTAGLTRLPLVGRLVQTALFQGDAIYYLPIEESVSPSESTALPTDVVRHFIAASRYRWVMNECICRASSACNHYPVDIGCLFLGEATRQINPALGRPVSYDEAISHLERCQEAGLVHLIGRNKLDSVWLKAKPGTRLLTICNCCDCCCLWKVLSRNAYRPIADSVHRMPGIEVVVSDHCQGCGTCVDQCFVQAITLQGERAVIGANCLGCGRCVTRCPEEAIELKGTRMEELNNDLIKHLSELVEV